MNVIHLKLFKFAHHCKAVFKHLHQAAMSSWHFSHFIPSLMYLSLSPSVSVFVLQYRWPDSLSVPPSTRSSMRSTFYQDSAKTKTNARRMCATLSGSTTLHATTGAWVLGHALHLCSIAHCMLMSTLDLCLYIVALRTACIGYTQCAFRRFIPEVLDCHTLPQRKKIFSYNERTCSLLTWTVFSLCSALKM